MFEIALLLIRPKLNSVADKKECEHVFSKLLDLWTDLAVQVP